MPTDNYDASLVMMRKRNATLAAYNSNMVTIRNTMNYNTARREQGGDQTAEVVAMRSQGCKCDTSTAGYTRRVVAAVVPNAQST